MKSNSGPEKPIVDSKTITDAEEICTQLNTYFSTIGLSLADEIEAKISQVSNLCIRTGINARFETKCDYAHSYRRNNKDNR